MDPNASPESDAVVVARNEVFRRIGRNLFLFQDIEAKLKYLAIAAGVEGPFSKLAQRVADRANKLSQKSMGILAGKLFSGVLSKTSRQKQMQTDTWRLSVRVEVDDQYAEQLEAQIRSLVDERNRWAHHASTCCDFQSHESMRAAGEELDLQRIRILEVGAELSTICDGIRSHVEELAPFVNSPEFDARWRLACAQRSLIDFIKQSSEEWVPLERVGQVRRRFVDQLEEAHRSEVPGTRRLLEQTGAVEFRNEPCRTGGFRAFCRLRDKDSSSMVMCSRT
jgi:hypothetical protein